MSREAALAILESLKSNGQEGNISPPSFQIQLQTKSSDSQLQEPEKDENKNPEVFLRPELLKSLQDHADNQLVLQLLSDLGDVRRAITTLSLIRNRGPKSKDQKQKQSWTMVLNGAISILEKVQKEDLDTIMVTCKFARGRISNERETTIEPKDSLSSAGNEDKNKV